MLSLGKWTEIAHTSAMDVPVSGVFGNVIEAWREGVVERHWTEGHKPGTIIDVYRVPCNKFQMIGFYESMRKKKGCKYDFKAIAGFPLRADLNDKNKWFCSEAVFDSALEVNVRLLANIKANKVFPVLLNLSPIPEYYTQLVVPQPVFKSYRG